MKTVAKSYNIDVGVELEELELRDLISMWKIPSKRDRMEEYLRSDVHITREMSKKVYFRQKVGEAELNVVPLSACVDNYKSFFPKLMHAREFNNRKYVAFDTNRDRYDGRRGNIYRIGSTNGEDEGKLRYQGASVGIAKTGLFGPVWHLDFGSFYPTTIRTFNLSPETTHFVPLDNPDKLSLKKGEYKFLRKDGYLYLSIPDEKLHRQIYIRIDNTNAGFLSTSIADALETRLKYKKQAQVATGDEAAAIDSWQQALKILINSIYGIEGLESTEFGSLPIAIATVAICRWVIDAVADKIGEAVIEKDTDGLYLSEAVDIDEINKFIKTLLKRIDPSPDTIIGGAIEKTGIPGFINMELNDPYEAGVFYGMKNYILKKYDSDTVIISGSAIKSSKHCPGIKRMIQEIAKLQIRGANNAEYKNVLATHCDPGSWSIDDFSCSSRFSKAADDQGDYKRITTTLSEQLSALDEPPGAGDQVEFFYTKTSWAQRTGYISQSESKQIVTIRPHLLGLHDINTDKYREQIEKVLDAFGIDTKTIITPSIMDLL
jgi:DNA polymerase elongation subunit (family B)